MPSGVYVRVKTLKDRLIEKIKINPENGCWEWQAAMMQSGYGKISIRRSVHTGAHRASYTVFNGEIPDGMVICHKCDNKKCINPDHLFIGTYLDNSKDAQSKGRVRCAPHPSYNTYKKGCRCGECMLVAKKFRHENKELIKQWSSKGLMRKLKSQELSQAS